MNKKDYAVYLKSTWWVSFSKRIRDERKICEKCGIDKTLNVHHLTYANKGEEKDEDVIVVCRTCHKLIHGIIIKKKRYESKKIRNLKIAERQRLGLCTKCGNKKIILKGYNYFCPVCQKRKNKLKRKRERRRLGRTFNLPLEEKIKLIKRKQWLT